MNSILTVTDPAPSQALTTLDAVKAELKITDGGSDADLTRMIGEASSTIAGYCKRVLVDEGVKEVFRLDARRRWPALLRLSRYPVTEITQVTVDGTVADDSCYEIDAEGGLLYRLVSDFRQPWCARKIEVDYSGGYLTSGDLPPLLPPAIGRAAITLVKQAWFAADRDPLVKMEQVQDVSMTEYWVGTVPGVDASSLPPEVKAALQPYVKADR